MQLALPQFFAGILLLFLGRRLFWLFVGLVGFMAGFTFATSFFSIKPEWLVYVIALVAGLIGILLALFFQRLAIALAGFLAGGLFSISAVEMAGLNVAPIIIFLIGGFLGAILLSVLFDWVLIFLSSATGAMLIARSFPLDPLAGILVFLGLLMLGVFVQARLIRVPPATRPQ